MFFFHDSTITVPSKKRWRFKRMRSSPRKNNFVVSNFNMIKSNFQELCLRNSKLALPGRATWRMGLFWLSLVGGFNQPNLKNMRKVKLEIF